MLKPENAKERLKTLCGRHIQTTMIGALDAIETILGELWNHGSLDRTDEEEEIFCKFEQLRSKILDTGNGQKRKMEEEFECFDVNIKVNQYVMPVKSRN